jgi:uncharacterized membrane protein YbaN (DUF454 family)
MIARMRRTMRRTLWIAGGIASLALGAAGVVLPLLPTTPFVLLAAFCFARSSPRLHRWLLHNRRFGPLITAWRDERAIPARAKRMAYLAMAAVFLLSVLFSAPWHVLAIQGVVLGLAALFIATRPVTSSSKASGRGP